MSGASPELSETMHGHCPTSVVSQSASLSDLSYKYEKTAMDEAISRPASVLDLSYGSNKVAIDEVVVNIGGNHYFTTRSTLEKFDGFLRSLCTYNPSKSVLPFVDRDPIHFRYILNFMRGSNVLPTDPLTLRELQIEADFYCLEGLKHLLRQKISIEVETSNGLEIELRRIREKISA